MPQDSVGAKEVESCEYNQGGKNWYMPQDSVSAEVVTIVSTAMAVGTATCIMTA